MTSYMLVENNSQRRPFFARSKHGKQRMGFREFREFSEWQEDRQKRWKDEQKPKPPQGGGYNFIERFMLWLIFGPIFGSLWIVASVKCMEWAFSTIKTIVH